MSAPDSVTYSFINVAIVSIARLSCMTMDSLRCIVTFGYDNQKKESDRTMPNSYNTRTRTHTKLLPGTRAYYYSVFARFCNEPPSTISGANVSL